MIYIKKSFKGFYFEIDETLSSESFAIGTTFDDFLDGKFVLLSDEQVEFHVTNPSATVKEVFDMVLESTSRTLADAKNEMESKINEYRNSENVCKFTINNEIEGWFEESELENYKLVVDALTIGGSSNTFTFYIGDDAFEIPAKYAQIMIAKLVIYINACNSVEQGKYESVDVLTEIDDVDTFDYTSGYPTVVNFNFTEE